MLCNIRILADVELIATKAYHASGIITVTIIYDVSRLTRNIKYTTIV